MQNQTATAPETTQAATLEIAAHHHFTPAHVVPFADFVEAVAALCSVCAPDGASFWSAGHLFPDLEIAIDRTGMRPAEIIGHSPFAGDIETIFRQEIRPNDILWVSNPNRITGSHYTVNEIERIAKLVPRGLLIVDEAYPCCFGISAESLLESCQNIVLVRPINETSGEAGFFVTRNEQILQQLHGIERKLMPVSYTQQVLSQLDRKTDEANRIEQLYNESLRLALYLSRMEVRCWITATDFLLLRVADPVGAGNHFAANHVTIENLSGYPQLEGYLRYRIQSQQVNEQFLGAMQSMPEQFRMARSSDLFNLPQKASATIESREYLNRVKHIFAEQEAAEQLERVSAYSFAGEE